MIRTLHETYRARCHEAGNINEHLPVLFMLSIFSDGVAEFGIDRGHSTSALMAGQEARAQQGLPAAYYGYDVNPACRAEVERLIAIRSTDFTATAYTCSTVKIESIPTVDLLLIDSEHTEAQIKQELARHAASVRRYIALHDTVTYGENGEKPGTRGILYGISVLLAPPWRLIYDSPRNNGLSVFERVNP